MDTLNVAQFLAAYNASLADVLELKASTITGILEPKSDKIYGGELYWVLVDGGARLTVHIPERDRDLSGRRVEVTGPPSRQTNEDRGEIEVILRVQSITPLDPTPEDWIGPLLPIGEKRRSSWSAIERSIESRILAGDQPRVLMFFGASSIVDKDVLAALGQHATAYHIVERRIPLTDPAAVAAALSGETVNADLVAIVRGGGEGISALSGPPSDRRRGSSSVRPDRLSGWPRSRPTSCPRSGALGLSDSYRIWYLARSQSDRCHPSA